MIDSAPALPVVGLFGANLGPFADPATATRLARRAERLGYESLWAADHVVLPAPRTPESPLEPDQPLLEPLVALTHLASRTERIRLGTGCIVLPQRNPLVLAKQLASLDVVSDGRLLFGTAVGYLEPELRALGVPVRERGAQMDEYLRAVRSLWEDEHPSQHGKFVDFAGVDAHPRPRQRPVPLLVGGHSRAAHRRAARYGDEWFGFRLSPAATAEQLRSLAGAAAEVGRQGPPLRITVAPSRPLDPDTVRAYAELGVHRLVVITPYNPETALLEELVERNAPELIGARPH
ncbi:LLM class F420-dependent oxidoreductase [Kitasatospora sp. NPDC088783]|uniref:LLM class F420-dependent oxidoreductase n=1 Tax=Kitasatospora sp. NPDC088783 TaxID=3364077 RepID=UPI0038220249